MVCKKKKQFQIIIIIILFIKNRNKPDQQTNANQTSSGSVKLVSRVNELLEEYVKTKRGHMLEHDDDDYNNHESLTSNKMYFKQI